MLVYACHLLLGLLLSLPGPPLPPPVRYNPPVPVSDEYWRPLREHNSPVLQQKLEQRIRQNGRWWGLVEAGKMGIGFVDMREPASPRFAHLNGDTMLYAASLSKIGVLLAVFDAMDKGKLEDSLELQSDLDAMIRDSSNPAATRLIEMLGIREICHVLERPPYNLYDTDRGGGLWVGRRYAAGGETHPDPVKGLTHAANATQVCRFYYLLATGRLINPEEQSWGIA